MSPELDRIPVPTNGKGPHPASPVPLVTEAGSAEQPTDPREPPDPTLDPFDSIGFTPAQLAVGFGVIASLVLFAVARARRRRGGSGGGFFERR